MFSEAEQKDLKVKMLEENEERLASEANMANGDHQVTTPRCTAIAISSPRKLVNTESPLSPPSDDDDDAVAGPQRLVEDPDSPTSRLLERAARRSLQEAESSSHPERRFSFINDIARNPRLAPAARLELDAASGCPSPAAPSSGSKTPTGNGPAGLSNLGKRGDSGSGGRSGAFAYFQHSTEVERQASLIAQLDSDAKQESRINQGMANVMLGRLQSGKTAAEKVLSVLQAFASAEAAYSRAMKALSEVTLSGDADGPTLRTAMTEFSALPAALGVSHSAVAEILIPVIRSVQSVVGELRTACSEIGLGTTSAQRSVEASRKGLKAALAAHREACRAFDSALMERQKVGSRSRSVESDPWIAEGRLVEKQAALQDAQSHQRLYLKGAFRKAGELERRRVDVACSALAALLEVPRATALPELAAVGERMALALHGVDCEADLDGFSAVAGNSIRNGEALSARQSELVRHLWAELTSSAEIVRQGEVQRYDAGKNVWSRGYAVLTRAGFLHWFAAPGDGSAAVGAWGCSGAPLSSFNLARCEFEQGEAPEWRLLEGSGGGLNGWLAGGKRALSLRTVEVEACMDWTADLRELLAVCASR